MDADLAPAALPPATPPAGGAPRSTFFLSLTPLHTFWWLGLLHGPWRPARQHTLALIDQASGQHDYLAETIAERGRDGSATGPVEVRRFGPLGKGDQARTRLHEIAAAARAAKPDAIAGGNDHRPEFHAALWAAPRAMVGYVDDGLYSYLARSRGKGWLHGGAMVERLSGWRQSLRYGLPVERPNQFGGSRAVREAWVLRPDLVHAGLKRKRLHAIDPAWYAGDDLRVLCEQALAHAGLAPARLAAVETLLLLPNDNLLREHPALAERFAALARRIGAAPAGGDGLPRLAVKRHPKSVALPPVLAEALAGAGALDIPPRLPVELLVPALRSARLAVGTLTSALVSLGHLKRDLVVRSLAVPAASGLTRGDVLFQRAAERFYRSAGIEPLEGELEGSSGSGTTGI